jgi:hypothetical protein
MAIDRLHPDSDMPPRPGDLARILLAGCGGPPRARARDQQADLAGEALRKDVLNRIILLDPEPDDLDSALLAIVEALGEPTGPTRAIALAIRQEWEDVLASPGAWSFLVREALQCDQKRPPRRHHGPDQTDPPG